VPAVFLHFEVLNSIVRRPFVRLVRVSPARSDVCVLPLASCLLSVSSSCCLFGCPSWNEFSILRSLPHLAHWRIRCSCYVLFSVAVPAKFLRIVRNRCAAQGHCTRGPGCCPAPSAPMFQPSKDEKQESIWEYTPPSTERKSNEGVQESIFACFGHRDRCTEVTVKEGMLETRRQSVVCT
jgi:hypothetical protein